MNNFEKGIIEKIDKALARIKQHEGSIAIERAYISALEECINLKYGRPTK